jgi:FtsP/CotA-like multicopper oxidase with cupredoxin domain
MTAQVITKKCFQLGRIAGRCSRCYPRREAFTYEFIARHPGTYWYHSHQVSSIQAKKGLVGRFIVEPARQPVNSDKDYTMML